MKFYLILILLLLSACVPKVYEPYPRQAVSLPEDDAAHLAPIEWWYYTGHLYDENGKDYGFELSFFKAYAPKDLRLLGAFPAYILFEKGHVAHFALTDKQAQSLTKAERADFWGYPASTSSERLDVSVANWYVRKSADGKRHELYATLGDKRLKLSLLPLKPAALHGDPPGIQSMGPGGISYYVSYTRMDVEGTLETNCTFLGCKSHVLTGQAWHDHQWGDFDLSSYAGWDWFSLQFDDQTELMLYLIREADGTYSTRAGSYIDKNGKVLGLKAEDFSLTSSGEAWESEATGAIYPVKWHISVPKLSLELDIIPEFNEQEMDTRASTGIVYWEGAVKVSGSQRGLGYVELTNYDLYPYGASDKNGTLKPLRGPLGLF